jgi:hypothetical protein
MESRVIHKFYEPLVLLKALNLELQDAASYYSVSENEACHSDEQVFQAFVNKLAFVCDSVKGRQGSTITSIVILQEHESDPIDFWFASNLRTSQELEQTASFMRLLLQGIGQTMGSQSTTTHAPQRGLLRDVLRFNIRRIKVYVRGLRSQAELCLDKCIERYTEQGLWGRLHT